MNGAERFDRETQFRRILWPAALLPLGLTTVAAFVLAWQVSLLLREAQWVDHSDRVIAQAQGCYEHCVSMQTGVRGYQLTGSTNFLEPYWIAQATIDDAFSRTAALIADNPGQAAQWDLVQASFGRWRQFASDVIAATERGVDVRSIELNRTGKQLFDEFRSAMNSFVAAEERLRAQRAEAFDSYNTRVLQFRFLALTALGLILSVYIWRKLRRVALIFGQSEMLARERAEELGRAKEVLRAAHENLERKVEERTRELTEANTRLQELDRLKSEFLATMSHELRTPLNSILGFTEIVMGGLAGPLNDEQKKQLGMAHNSARHLLNLINDLLDLARVESGRVEPHMETFNGREVIEEAIATVAPLAAKKDIAIESRWSAPEEIRSDRKMFFQIVLNLLNNAVKFTERGRVEVTTRVSEGALRVDVNDTGIGIKPDNMNMLFEAFRQVDGSARRRYEGTGLGLHLSRRLAHLLGGDIRATSTHGQGSTFTVSFPLERIQSNETQGAIDRGQRAERVSGAFPT